MRVRVSMLQYPPYCLLDTRTHRDSLLTSSDDDRGNIGKRLVGLQFSGKRSVLFSKSTPTLSVPMNKDHPGDVVDYGRTIYTSNQHAASVSVVPDKLLSKSALSLLNKGCCGKGIDGIYRTLPHYNYGSAASYRSARQTSETFAEGITTFRKHKHMRQMAARRWSDRLQEQHVSCVYIHIGLLK